MMTFISKDCVRVGRPRRCIRQPMLHYSSNKVSRYHLIPPYGSHHFTTMCLRKDYFLGSHFRKKMKRKIINSNNPFSENDDNHLDVVDKRSCRCFNHKFCSSDRMEKRLKSNFLLNATERPGLEFHLKS